MAKKKIVLDKLNGGLRPKPKGWKDKGENFYNDSVNEYNIRIRSVPDFIIAYLIKYKAMPLFQASESDRQDVKIDFSDVKV